MASITIQVPDQEALEYDLDAIEQLTIGRGPDNDVVIDHVSMSGSHASIHNEDGTFQLRDLGSTNGTFVDGSQIEEVTLESGAQIEFGKVQAFFADAEIPAEGEEEEFDLETDLEAGAQDQDVVGVEMAEASHLPADFKNLSPIEKVEKKNTLGQIAIFIGIVAILAAIALIVFSTTMQAA